MLTKVSILCITAWTCISCNNSMDRLLRDEYPESGTQAQTGKVLLIVIDGASGRAVNEAYNTQKTPNIRSMRENSLITFEGLADMRHDNLPEFTNERGWANMMTGVTTHGIGLEEEPGGEPKPIEELEIPSFLQRIKQMDAKKRISLYTSDNDFHKAFSKDVDVAHNANTDQEVNDMLIGEIATDEDVPSDVIVTQFSSVQVAGEEYGFIDELNEPTDAVVEAIEKIDGYIGEILTVLEARRNYKEENWLIIISSTYGGVYPNVADAATYYDDPRLNTFTLMYNYQMVGKVLVKPGDNELNYNYTTPIYNGMNEDAYARVKDPELFEMPIDQSFTVQFMYYSIANREHWSNVLSKTNRWRGNRGWEVIGDRDRLMFIVGGKWIWTSQRGTSDLNPDPLVNRDGKWHTITMVFDRENKRFRAYVDGIYSTHRDQAEWEFTSDLSCADFALSIGRIANSPNEDWANFCVSNIQIYDVALPQDYIKNNHGLTQLEEVQNDYWDNLIGYWPCDREEDSESFILKDYSQYAASRDGRSDMVLAHKRPWAVGRSVEENLRPTPDVSYYQAVINTVDVSFQAMQWLGLSPAKWGFEGIARAFQYTFMEND